MILVGELVQIPARQKHTAFVVQAVRTLPCGERWITARSVCDQLTSRMAERNFEPYDFEYQVDEEVEPTLSSWVWEI